MKLPFLGGFFVLGLEVDWRVRFLKRGFILRVADAFSRVLDTFLRVVDSYFITSDSFPTTSDSFPIYLRCVYIKNLDYFKQTFTIRKTAAYSLDCGFKKFINRDKCLKFLDQSRKCLDTCQNLRRSNLQTYDSQFQRRHNRPRLVAYK